MQFLSLFLLSVAILLKSGYIFSNLRKIIRFYLPYMDLSRNSGIFRGLNTRIVLYFIAFAFAPLLIFSILGYMLNKDMLTHINLSKLYAVNRSYLNEVNAYLDYCRQILSYETPDLDDSRHLTPERMALVFNALLRCTKSDSVWLFRENPATDDPEILPFIEYSTGKGVVYRGYLSLTRLADLLPSSVPDMRNSIVFSRTGHTLSSDGYLPVIDRVDQNFLEIKDRDSWDIYDEKSGMFFAYSRMKSPGMFMRTQMDAQSFYEELAAFRDKILLANLLLALILIGLAIFYSRQITTPLHQLIKAVQNIRRGDLNHRIKLASNDEIGILANEFELMRSRLQESYQDMENKIRKRTEELQGAQTQITHQEKMASLGLMAAGIAHEIGNPLTSISSMAQVIKRKTSNEKTIEYVNNILKNIDRISRIVREMVDFSKPSSQKVALTDINELINSAVGILKYDRRSKNINYVLNLDQNIPRTIVVADHLLQVFLNILINAVDASEGFGNNIEVSTFTTNGSIEIDIRDQGCGIPDDKLNTIFDPFYTTKEVGKGTGLGLTVSYGLIQKMNGEIKVESKLREGSNFRVIIPIKKEFDQNV